MSPKPLNWFKNYNLLIFDEIDSTNLEARRLIKNQVRGNFIILSSTQTAGKGTSGRKWVSEAGNLYISILIKSYHKLTTLGQLSFITSLAVYDTITSLNLNTKNISLKWPNDIIVNDAKLAGILLESHLSQGNNIAEYVIVGIGINILNSPIIPDKQTTSILEITGQQYDVFSILNSFMNYFDKYYYRWQMEGFAKLRKMWLSKAYQIGQVITVVSPDNNRISGIFKDIDLNGAMRLKLASGQIYSLHSGEILTN